MEKYLYSEPVAKLLSYGDAREIREWPNYLELGFTREHIPELLRMLTDDDLIWADSDSLDVWAPLHAWRVLGQLHAVEAIDILLDQLYRIDDENDDWIAEEFPDVLALIGPPSIPALASYLADRKNGLYARICATESLGRIGNAYSDAHSNCQEILSTQLQHYRQNDPALNGFLIVYLAELHAVDALDIVQQAYRHNRVDLSILGDFEDAEIEFGVRQRRSTPPPQYQWVFEGDEPPEVKEAPVHIGRKIGRNEPCPCGSGKKYKKCCLNKS